MKTLSLVAGLITALSTAALGTQIKPTPIAELVEKADYILVGEIVKADIIDREGRTLADPKSRTGSGYTNTIRYHVVVDQRNIIKGKWKNIPKKLIVPKWSEWHATLENEKPRVEGKRFIFLLAGKDFAPVSEPESVREMTERISIENLVKKKWIKRQATGSSDGMRN